MTNLEPCPFCGAAPKVEEWTELDRSYPDPEEFRCVEISCGRHATARSALEWNTRAVDPDSVIVPKWTEAEWVEWMFDEEQVIPGDSEYVIRVLRHFGAVKD